MREEAAFLFCIGISHVAREINTEKQTAAEKRLSEV